MARAANPQDRIELPQVVGQLIGDLENAGHEAYAVGGGVRDSLLQRQPKDWDIATNANPEQIQKVFPKSVYTNRFGTVGVSRGGQVYDITTYRVEHGYRDARHPDTVKFVRKLSDDLARRDFTVNGLAASRQGNLTDPFGGLADLKAKRLRAVGSPEERFSEDALRLIRAVRFAAELGFTIEPKTRAAIKQQADKLKQVSAERIRDEFMRIISSDRPYEGLMDLVETGLLETFLPELLEGSGMDQPKHHKYPVLEHSLLSLKHTPSADPLIRLGSLLHDVGKPRAARGSGDRRTFYGHEVVGARMTKEIMKRLRFSKADTDRVVNLVRHHMFLYQFETTDKAVRRIIRRVGLENIDDLVTLRVGDRLGSGCKIGYTTKLKQFKQRVVDVQKDPIDTRLLKVNGRDLIRDLKLKPGPAIGQTMDALLEEVLDDPKRNTKRYLMKRARELQADGRAGKPRTIHK